MLTPDYKTFLQLSRDATLIPVAKTLGADMLTPVGAFLSVAAGQNMRSCWNRSKAARRLGATPLWARSRVGA